MSNRCSLCHTPGTSRTTCPLNPDSQNVNYDKHYLVGGGESSQKDSSKKSKSGIKAEQPPYVDNIEELTVKNTNFRKVLYTTPTMQLVLMSLLPHEDIGMEIHEDTTQFFRIEEGNAVAILDGVEHPLKTGDVLIVPPKTEHNVINTSDKKRLQIYSLYSPPHHPPDRLQKYKPKE